MNIMFRHRKTPSSDRFLGAFSLSSPPPSSVIDLSADELTEADLFWTADNSSESTRSSTSSSDTSLRNNNLGFRKSGILAALPDNHTTTPFSAIPKPPPPTSHRVELTQSAPCRKFQHSAPVNVPAMAKKPRKFGQLTEERENEIDDDEDDEEEMLPPHEIVAMKLKSTSSVLEGVGRTLKGRDLRQVRNAVWNQTGFLD